MSIFARGAEYARNGTRCPQHVSKRPRLWRQTSRLPPFRRINSCASGDWLGIVFGEADPPRLLCALCLNLDVNRNRLADPGHGLGRW